MTATINPYASAEYQANRSVILSDHPVCHWCRRKPATTADHLVSLAEGGDHSLANLVPSCHGCNESRGGKLGRAKQLNGASKPEFLGARKSQHPPVLASPSGEAKRYHNGSSGIVGKVPQRGRNQPRLLSCRVGSDTLGPRVWRWGNKHMPFKLMPWNRDVLNLLLATEDGKLLHRSGLVTVARQNSKTFGIGIPLAGWWLDEYADEMGPQVVTWTAHDLRLSEVAFHHLVGILDQRITRISSSYGRQRIILDNGSMFHVCAATIGAGHGLSIDLAICDEFWRISAEAVEHGLLPAQRARPMPLMVALSTAGDADSTLLRSWRERGLAQVETQTPGRLFFAEWSPPPGVDYNEAKWWAYANPALGNTIDSETLADEWQAPNRNAFLRAALNLWVMADECWLEPGVWDRTRVRSTPETTGGVICCEVSQGGEMFYGVHCAMRNGVAYVEPVLCSDREDDLWAMLDSRYPDIDQIGLTPHLEAHTPTSLSRKVITVGQRELAKWTPLVRSMINVGNVAHAESALLDEHVGRGVMTRQTGLSTAHSSGSIELARTMVWSVAMASRPSTSRKPMIAVASQ